MILRGCECAEAFVGDVPGEAQPGLASRPSDFSIFNGKPKWLWTLNHSLREKPWVLWEFSLIHIIHVAQSCQDLCRELVNKGLTESCVGTSVDAEPVPSRCYGLVRLPGLLDVSRPMRQARGCLSSAWTQVVVLYFFRCCIPVHLISSFPKLLPSFE